MRAPLLILASSLSVACSTSVDCASFAPAHPTVDGVAQVADTMQGDRVEDVLRVTISADPAVDASALTVIVEPVCDDGACAPTFECTPDELGVTNEVTCAVIDDIAGGDCDWSCEVGITATALDSDICSDRTAVYAVSGRHIVDAGCRGGDCG